MKQRVHHYLHVFFLLAFITAGISPACQFVSGKKTLMQICFSDGSLKTVELAGQFNPYELLGQNNKTKKTDKSHAREKQQDCGFCFAQSHQLKMPLASIELAVGPVSSDLTLGAGSFAYKAYELNAFQSRGPPIFS